MIIFYIPHVFCILICTCPCTFSYVHCHGDPYGLLMLVPSYYVLVFVMTLYQLHIAHSRAHMHILFPVCQSLSDLVVRSHEASERLRQMNVFKYVEIVWDTVKSPGGHGAAEGGLVVPEETVQVTFMVKESGRVKSTVGVEAGTQSGGGVS